MLHLLINKEFHSAIIILFLTAVFTWITPSVFAADKATEKPLTIQTIKKTGSVTERGKLIIGGDQDYPPYEFLEKGKPSGFNIELVLAVAEVMGFDVEIRLAPWAQVRQDLEQGRIDVISGMYFSKERDEAVDFSVHHSLVSPGLFVRKHSRVNSFKDIQGLEIIAQKGDIMHDYLEKAAIASGIITVAEPVEALRLVASGKHDGALLSSELQGQYFISSFKLDNLRNVRTDIAPRKYCFAVTEGNLELLQKLDEGLNILKATGRYRDIYEKWFGIYEEETFWQRAKYIVWALILAIIFFGLSILWSRSLKKQVIVRTEELRLSAKELLESESRFREVLENSPDAIYRRSYKENRFEYMSPASEKVLGFKAEEIMSMPIQDVLGRIHPDDIEMVKRVLKKAVEAGGGPYFLEFRFKTREGCYNWIEDKFTVTKGAIGGALYRYGNVRDTSAIKAIEEEKKLLQEQLHQSQKLESLGVLAGGIAHDFNNILTAIVGNADLALKAADDPSSAKGRIENIKSAAFRASDLCRQMLAYSGKGRFIVVPLNLSALIADMKNMLDVSISKKVRLDFSLKMDIPAIEADVSQIQQIILNLLINASEAIGERPGSIMISTGEMFCDRKCVEATRTYGDISEGRYVWMEVADDGCGMDKETMEKIFDPFFTTKFTGRGLGLAATMGIVLGHNGALSLFSEPGRGSRFKVLLPASEALPVDLKQQETENDDWHWKGTVLLADDEDIVREICRHMLEEFGFEVIEASNGQKAIAAFRANREKICLVLLDLTMPELGGEEVIREIRHIDPEIPVILSSGYNEQDVVSRFAGRNLSGFVQKPYMSETLGKAIRRVLGTHQKNTDEKNP